MKKSLVILQIKKLSDDDLKLQYKDFGNWIKEFPSDKYWGKYVLQEEIMLPKMPWNPHQKQIRKWNDVQLLEALAFINCLLKGENPGLTAEQILNDQYQFANVQRKPWLSSRVPGFSNPVKGWEVLRLLQRKRYLLKEMKQRKMNIKAP